MYGIWHTVLKLKVYFKASKIYSKYISYALFSAPADFILEGSPVKIWPVKPLSAEKQNFPSPRCILHNLNHPDVEMLNISRWFSKLHPNEFWYHPGGSTQAVLGVC